MCIWLRNPGRLSGAVAFRGVPAACWHAQATSIRAASQAVLPRVSPRPLMSRPAMEQSAAESMLGADDTGRSHALHADTSSITGNSPIFRCIMLTVADNQLRVPSWCWSLLAAHLFLRIPLLADAKAFAGGRPQPLHKHTQVSCCTGELFCKSVPTLYAGTHSRCTHKAR